MSRLSIYAGQQGTLRGFRKAFPPALASAWRARDGTMAIAVANIVDRPLATTVILDSPESRPVGPGRFRDVSGERAEEATVFDAQTLRLRLELRPLEARVLEWR